MRWLLSVLVTMVACGSSDKKPGNRPMALLDCGEKRCRDLAEDHARGRGVPRDYAAAYRAYVSGCEAEDALACREVARALVDGLGVAPDRSAFLPFLQRACRLDDVASCAMMALLQAMDPRETHDDAALERAFSDLEVACARGDGDACMFKFGLHSLGQYDCGTGCQSEEHDELVVACRGGSLEGCTELVDRTSDDERFAHERVTVACDDGAAEACAVLPGRAIPLAELCAASDFRACMKAAAGSGGADEYVAGDGDSGRRACDVGILDACIDGAIAFRDGATDRTADALAMLGTACQGGEKEACELAADPDLATGCAAFEPTRIPKAQRTKAPVRPLPALVVTKELGVEDHHEWDALVATAATGVQVYIAVDDPAEVPAGLEGVLPLVAAQPVVPIDGDLALVDDHGQVRATLVIGPQAALPRCVTALLAE